MMLTELQAPPPRVPGPLLDRSLRRMRQWLYVLGIIVVGFLCFIDGNALYAQTHGAPGMSNLNYVESVAIAAGLITLAWLLQLRPLTQTMRTLYRDGLAFEARVQSIGRSSRRKVAFAVFKYESQDLVVAADMGGIKVQQGDACQALYDPKTGLGCIVWNDKFLATCFTPSSRMAAKSG